MEERNNTRQPSSNAIQQQQLWAYRPAYTPKSIVSLFLLLSVCFIIFGSVCLALALEIEEHRVRYDDLSDCTIDNNGAQTCFIDFTLKTTMSEPVFLYYELHNFYQNHRLYVKSRSYEQLKGNVLSIDELESCNPVNTNEDAGQFKSYEDWPLDANDAANPCGLAAHTLFTDSFEIEGKAIANEHLSWESDSEYMYRRPDRSGVIQWQDVEDERFISWMKIAVHPTFRKLWGVITEDLEAGTHTMTITNLYDVREWNGEKHIVLTSASQLGGSNVALGVAFLSGGCFSLVAALVVSLVAAFYKQEGKPHEGSKWR